MKMRVDAERKRPVKKEDILFKIVYVRIRFIT